MYLSSASELTKFAISRSFCESIPHLIGTLFIDKEIPEVPKSGFLKGLFGPGPSSFDREELFGETYAGKPPVTVSRQGNPSGLDQIKSGSVASELARAREVSAICL